ALAWASTLCLVTYAIAYKRHAQSILEAEGSALNSHDGCRSRLSAAINRVLVKHPIERACFRFIGAILTRSSNHQMFAANYLATGFSLGLTALFRINPDAVFPFAISQEGMLALPLTLSFFVVSGFRAAFNMPYQLQANWMFQTTDSGDTRPYAAGTRKWVL